MKNMALIKEKFIISEDPGGSLYLICALLLLTEDIILF